MIMIMIMIIMIMIMTIMIIFPAHAELVCAGQVLSLHSSLQSNRKL